MLSHHRERLFGLWMSDLSVTPEPPDLTPDPLVATVGPTWQEQDGLLRDLWMQNKPPQAIADALNRSVSAIMTRAARLGLPRRAAPGRKPNRQISEGVDGQMEVRRAPLRVSTPASTAATAPQTSPRVCLMCLKTFQSLGRHNRICSSCKNSAEYNSASTLSDIHLPTS